MERLNPFLKPQVIAFVGVLVATGVWVAATSRVDTKRRTESEMEQMAPMKVGGMSFTPDATNKLISYKMDDMTYNTLQPFGIVARQYTDGTNIFDAVIIASRSKESFHDPRVCFSAQGWTLEKFVADNVQTKTRGVVPITLIQMTSEQARNKMAAFFYRGPGGKFYGNTQKLKLAMLLEQFTGGHDIDGIFYRVIPMTDSTDLPTFKKFIADWLDAAKESSNGYF